MKFIKEILIFIMTVLVCINLYGQNQNSNTEQYRKIDSLLNLYKNANHDTIKIDLINEKIGYYYERYKPDSSIMYYELAIRLADKNLDKISSTSSLLSQTFSNLKAKSLRYIGIVNYEEGSYDKAIQYFLRSLKIFEKLATNSTTTGMKQDAKAGMALCYNNIGNVHYDHLEFDKALEYYFKSLKLDEELSEKQAMSGCYINIGNAYFDMRNLENANEYYFKALNITEELGDKRGMSKCYNNIGNVLLSQGKFDDVIEYYQKSLKIKEEYDDKNGIAMVNANIAQLHNLIADSINNRQSFQDRAKHLNLAIDYGLKAIAIAHEIKAWPLENPVANTLMEAYEKLNNYKKSLEYAKIFIATKDSMFKDEKLKSVADAEKKFEAEKKQLQIEKLNKEKELQCSEILRQQEQGSRQKLVIIFIICGLLLVIVFAVFVVNRLRMTRKQKKIIEEQKSVVDDKNALLNQQNEEISAQRDEIEAQRDMVTQQKDHIEDQKKKITDSINYAKRIQQAVLPTGEFANSILGEHFILFKPKDIVSGDFYWATRMNEWLIFTVADCTGHGVPGGFMSMLGVSFLNEIVRKKEVSKASEVLDHLRNSIIEALQQKGQSEEQKDGMDMAICALNTIPLDTEKETYYLQYAGANNPLIIVTTSGELKVIEPDKQPVAIYEKMTPFKNNEMNVRKGDCLYLASDGYQDQFGGTNRRKFMVKRMKEVLVTIANKQMSEQQNILDSTFSDWKGEFEQIDDVTILGLKI
ncbi:MAG: tetratricopeptide repeat protein [Bacteroidota bacterium]